MAYSSTPDKRISEELAHRLLARAVQLDASRGTSISVADLRAAAVEAGIHSEAFDQAIQDTEAESSFPVGTPPFGRPSRWTPIVANALAAGGFWLSLVGLTSLARLFSVGWQLRHLADVLALVSGVALAHRLNARLARAAFIGMGAAQLAELIVQLFFGVQSVRGATTHWAVLLAGLLAVVGLKVSGSIAGRWQRSPAVPPFQPARLGLTSDAEENHHTHSHERLALLFLRQRAV